MMGHGLVETGHTNREFIVIEIQHRARIHPQHEHSEKNASCFPIHDSDPGVGQQHDGWPRRDGAHWLRHGPILRIAKLP